MPTEIKFLGLATFLIKLNDGRVVLIDPCLEKDNPVSPLKVDDLERVDVLCVSHLAGDHLGEAAKVAQKFQCPVVCGADVKYFLTCQGVNPDQFRTVTWNAQVNPRGIRIRSIQSMHASMGLAPDGKWLCGAPMGFLVYAADDCRIYHSGDSAIYSDLKLVGELYHPTIGLMCASTQDKAYYEHLGMKDFYGNEMSGEEGALAAIWLKLEYGIICHYLQPDGMPDVERFFSILNSLEGPRPIALRPGESFIYPPA